MFSILSFNYNLSCVIVCAWAPASVLGTPYAHVALRLLPVSRHSPAHTWRLGCVGLGTNGIWVMAPNSRGIGRVLGRLINGSSVKTKFYCILHQDSMFMGPRILNIIISFINIIIFIIINIINKIINKFERKILLFIL
jgi:hypothetical protein